MNNDPKPQKIIEVANLFQSISFVARDHAIPENGVPGLSHGRS
jgi:hypothetical protein